MGFCICENDFPPSKNDFSPSKNSFSLSKKIKHLSHISLDLLKHI